MQITVHYYAGAAEAAGLHQQDVSTTPMETYAALTERLAVGRERLGRVIDAATLLADGVRVADRSAAIGSTARLDVLPPFAGG